MWVFGYGSLLWKVDFPYQRKVKGYITGYSRRFYQGSEDHRGVPGKPGRVVTLVPSEKADHVWGFAFQIAPEKEEAVRSHLDFREKCGYETAHVTFHPEESENMDTFEMELYIGKTDNPHFLGPAKIEDLAQQIYESKGPSGPNTEYLFNLVEAVRNYFPNVKDDHLFELDTHVRNLCIRNQEREK